MSGGMLLDLFTKRCGISDGVFAISRTSNTSTVKRLISLMSLLS